jgi:hypothetical protein
MVIEPMPGARRDWMSMLTTPPVIVLAPVIVPLPPVMTSVPSPTFMKAAAAGKDGGDRRGLAGIDVDPADGEREGRGTARGRARS